MATPKQYTWMGWSFALAAVLVVIGAAILPPFVGETMRELLMGAFAGVCHQLPGRSPHVAGTPLALCDRCMGIYSGVALGIFAFPIIPRASDRVHQYAGLVLAGALLPLTLDWVGPVFGAWPNVPLSRVVTGGVFGVVAGMLVARAAARFNQGASAHSASLSVRPSRSDG